MGARVSRRANPLAEWLLAEGRNVAETPELLGELYRRAVAGGISLWRVQLVILTLHPQLVGTRYTWRRDADAVEASPIPHGSQDTKEYRASPYAGIFEGAGGIRRRLDVPGAKLDFPILEEIRAEGATDYVAMPFAFSDGQINVVTFACNRPGGFATDELTQISEMLPVLACVLETHALHRTAATLLHTYLGKHTGERVLNGLIKRGDGEDISAVIWFSDLRDSTVMADTMSRQAFLGILNSFFDCLAGAVLDHGGEVLRFVGDAVLAIFPTGEASAAITERARNCCSTEDACHAALAAAIDAEARIHALNGARAGRGEPALRFGLALHEGDVTYGNVGIPERLEFTVISAAANEAARLQDLCKTLDHSLLISAQFKRCFPGKLVSLGFHALRGVGTPQEVFTLPAD
ncbi:MAG: adenylate/guanylate cyclase domain-containing protein [Rhodospirillales bacterium]|nr:adenylate/guanylate cyclase domain-containing protein [Rhodospirillales bacterium]